MELTGAIQESLLAVLCYDKDGKAARMVQVLVPVNSYDPYFKELAEKAHAYLTQYKISPKEHTLDLIIALKERSPDKAEMFDRIYRSLQKTKAGINYKFVLDRATQFRRYQRCRGIIDKAMGALEKKADGYVEECEQHLASVTKQIEGGDLFDPGIRMNDPAQALSFLHRDQYDTFSSGIPEFDLYNIGPARGTTFMFMAPSNRGKSWACVHQGKTSLRERKNVIHISFEMSKEQVAQRYVQSFFSVTQRVAERLVYKTFKLDELGRLFSMEDFKIRDRPSLKDEDIYKLLSKKLNQNLVRKANFFVQDFPSGQFTTDRLEAYLDMIENTQRFTPDLLIIDYPDLMKLDPKNLRIETGQTHVRLRGIAQERNFALYTPVQSNRDGYGAAKGYIKEKHSAEDIVKFNNADIVITYNQTDFEREVGLARLQALKVRNDQKSQRVLISQAYGIGQFIMESAMMHERTYKDLLNNVKDKSDGSVSTEDED